MSNGQNNEEFFKTAIILGATLGKVLRQSQQRQMEEEKRISIRRRQVAIEEEKRKLIFVKNSLLNRLIDVMERTTNPVEKDIAEGRLNQIANADLLDIPEYQKLVDIAYPEPVRTRLPFPPMHMVGLINIPLSNQVLEQKEVKEEEKKINISDFSQIERFADDIKSGNASCAICLEKFTKNDKDVEIRRCLHTFHKKCLIPWETSGRSNGKTCPCCRQ